MYGRVTNVTERVYGSELAADAASGATSIDLVDPGDFDFAGGLAKIVRASDGLEEQIAYSITDEDSGTLDLAAPLVEDFVEEDRVELMDNAGRRSVDRLVYFLADDQEEELEAVVPFRWHDAVPLGSRDDEEEAEAIEVADFGGDLLLVDVRGRDLVVLHGAGLDIPAGDTDTPPEERMIRWLREADEETLGRLYTYALGSPTFAVLLGLEAIRASGQDQAVAALQALEADLTIGAHVSVLTSDGTPLPKQVHIGAGSEDLLILDEGGNSDLARLDGSGDGKIDIADGATFLTGNQPNAAGDLGARFGQSFVSTIASFAPGVVRRGYALPTVVQHRCTITGVRYRVGGVQNGNVKSGLMNAAGTTVASRTTNAPQSTPGTNNVHDVAFDSPYDALPGIYWRYLIFDSATAECFGGRILEPFLRNTEGTFTVPSSITPGSAATNSTVDVPASSTY